jgi:MYXO-CTERM domain-containing protein
LLHVALHNKLILILSREKYMRCILLKFIPVASIALLSAIYPCVGAAHDAIGATQMTLHQGQEGGLLKVQVKHVELLPGRLESGAPTSIARAAPVSVDAAAPEDESAGQTHGTWLAALVLMAAIAIRRQRS